MAASTQTIVSNSKSQVISARWIINGREDLVWFIGSVLTSYAMLVLYVQGWLPLLPMIAFWAIVIDGPHVFGTISRTYLDRSEWQTKKRMLLGSLLFFFIGPVLVLAGFAMEFLFVAALWAYYHLVKQHYGFMVLYKKKNNDLAPVDNGLDRVFLLLAFTCPFLAFISRDAEAMERVPPALRSSIHTIYLFVLAATLTVFAAWVIRQIQRALGGLPLNLPKYLLLAAAIPMHWVALLTPMPHKTIALVAILTVYHNIQYHRLIWFHNRKYSTGDGCRTRFGPAAIVSRNLIAFAVAALAFGLLYQGPRQYILGRQLQESRPWMFLATSFLWGFAFTHYYLDSKIWRVRRDPSVGQSLKMS